MVGVLHTWTRDLRAHPHLHAIVAGGGRAGDGTWLPSRAAFLVHVQPLSVIFRATFRDQRNTPALFAHGEEHVWKKAWVVHCQPVGSGEPACRYLAPDIVRVAIRNQSLLQLEDGHVTFQSQESAPDQSQLSPLTAAACIRRVLQPVLPDRCIKGSYDGLLSPSNRPWLNRARHVFDTSAITTNTIGTHPSVKQPLATPRCPNCGHIFILVQTLRPNTRSPPCL